MQVILLEKVQNLGSLGEQVNVKSGYARNFLLPKGKATVATPENIATFESRRAELEKAANGILSAATARKDKLESLGAITITQRAGDEGKLFGSVGNYDIAMALESAGMEISKKEIRLPEGPIRNIGEFSVSIHLHSDVNAEIQVVVEPE